MIVLPLYHREAHCLGGSESLGHVRARVWEVAVDGEVGIVLELELLLLLARDRDPVALVRVHLAGHHLLRLEPLFGSSAARGLSPLALSDSILLLFFELAAIHVLRGIGGPRPVRTLLVGVVPATPLRQRLRAAFLLGGETLLLFVFVVRCAGLRDQCIVLVAI